MAREDMITMTGRELKRIHIIHQILDKKVKQVEARVVLKLSERQIRRIVWKVRLQGDRGVVHESRGKPSHNALDQKQKEKIKGLYKRKYHDFGPTLACEKLLEIDKIRISDETLRKWLIAEGWWEKKRRHKKHRQWRERKHHCGEMIQMDGSHHDWLEGRGPRLVLMGYIDDATNRVFGRFYEYEGTMPALDSFKRYIGLYGIPQSVYLDKHSTYRSQAKPRIEDELENRIPLSHFEKSLGELAVDVLHANSPEAKGRIERLFRTFQDRLVKELRLKKASNIHQANECLEDYLPDFNRKFSVAALSRGDLHRSIPKRMNLESILSIRTPHPLRRDNTVIHQKRLYQVLDKTRSKRVIVEERIDGRMLIKGQGESLKYHEIQHRPIPPEPLRLRKPRLKRFYIPPQEHSWRNFKINRFA